MSRLFQQEPLVLVSLQDCRHLGTVLLEPLLLPVPSLARGRGAGAAVPVLVLPPRPHACCQTQRTPPRPCRQSLEAVQENPFPPQRLGSSVLFFFLAGCSHLFTAPWPSPGVGHACTGGAVSAVTTSPSPLMDVVSARPRQPSVPGSAEAARGREGCGRRRAALLSPPPSSLCRALSAGALEDFLTPPPRCCPGDFPARRREPCTPGGGHILPPLQAHRDARRDALGRIGCPWPCSPA